MGVFGSLLVYGIYSMLLGVILLFIPQIALSFFQLNNQDCDTWTRVLGAYLCYAGYFYIRSAIHSNMDFARGSVYTRLVSPIVILTLIFFYRANAAFLIFALVDATSAMWTRILLRNTSAVV